MAAKKDAVSFDEIIQAGRARAEKQRLADEILGRGHKNNTLKDGSRKPGTGPSLASRVGITKASQRSGSNTPKPKADIAATWGHDLHRANNPRSPRITRPPRENPMVRLNNDLLYDAAVGQSARNGTSTAAASGAFGEEISIRGTAGPYVVIGSNFAPGTTAADIESAMIPSGGEMQSCRIMSASPAVIAEMVFIEKHSAENVISTFNNKKADGRILHVYMKTGGPSPSPTGTLIRKTPMEPRASRIDLTRTELPSYDSQREQQDRSRRRADPEFQDGSYGFETQDEQMDVDMDTAIAAPVPASTPLGASRLDRRDDRRDDRREPRYDAPSDSGRGRSYYDRDRDGRIPRNDQRLYSDDLYPRPRGRDFR